MKVIALLFAFLFSLSLSAAQKDYSISCKGDDCFVDGWVMHEVNGPYMLNNSCKENDCEYVGWSSVDTNGDKFEVSCLPGGCFTEGWASKNTVGNFVLRDWVTCKNGDCLSYGWTVKTGYDLSGGNVSCVKDDCSRFGGTATWRGKLSRTACKNDDCYRYGWYLRVF